jgi:hypothetical protein
MRISEPLYVAHERDYKVSAKRKLDQTAPLEAALARTGLGEAVLAVFRATNLLSPFEQTRIQDVLRSTRANPFIRGAARFALGEIERGLSDMEEALKPNDVAKWTVATYLPFLWRPDEHMFLKPQVTRDFAQRVGHRFSADYVAQLRYPVYRSLMDLTEKTASEIHELAPRDNVDIQSFIWVVGKYSEDREQSAQSGIGD